MYWSPFSSWSKETRLAIRVNLVSPMFLFSLDFSCKRGPIFVSLELFYKAMLNLPVAWFLRFSARSSIASCLARFDFSVSSSLFLETLTVCNSIVKSCILSSRSLSFSRLCFSFNKVWFRSCYWLACSWDNSLNYFSRSTFLFSALKRSLFLIT